MENFLQKCCKFFSQCLIDLAWLGKNIYITNSNSAMGGGYLNCLFYTKNIFGFGEQWKLNSDAMAWDCQKWLNFFCRTQKRLPVVREASVFSEQQWVQRLTTGHVIRTSDIWELSHKGDICIRPSVCRGHGRRGAKRTHEPEEGVGSCGTLSSRHSIDITLQWTHNHRDYLCKTCTRLSPSGGGGGGAGTRHHPPGGSIASQ